jgi:hypothetical protein
MIAIIASAAAAFTTIVTSSCRRDSAAAPAPGASAVTDAVFSGDAHDQREQRITVHRLAPGVCVALYREDGTHEVAAALAAIACPSEER